MVVVARAQNHSSTVTSVGTLVVGFVGSSPGMLLSKYTRTRIQHRTAAILQDCGGINITLGGTCMYMYTQREAEKHDPDAQWHQAYERLLGAFQSKKPHSHIATYYVHSMITATLALLQQQRATLLVAVSIIIIAFSVPSHAIAAAAAETVEAETVEAEAASHHHQQQQHHTTHDTNNDNNNNSSSNPYIQELLEKSNQRREERRRERLEDYYRRNFSDYFDYTGPLSEPLTKEIQSWKTRNAIQDDR